MARTAEPLPVVAKDWSVVPFTHCANWPAVIVPEGLSVPVPVGVAQLALPFAPMPVAN